MVLSCIDSETWFDFGKYSPVYAGQQTWKQIKALIALMFVMWKAKKQGVNQIFEVVTPYGKDAYWSMGEAEVQL